MTENESYGKIPERKLPEFKVTKENIQEMKTTAAILNMLADNPDLTKKIAEEFIRASTAKSEERLIASLELKQNVSDLVAKNLRNVPAADIEKYYPYWSHITIRATIPPRIITPHGDPVGPIYGGEYQF
jgi:hypothetical protein